jgi:hypothetical protein
MNEDSVELCIETTIPPANDSSQSLESSMSTYDSMIQTLNDELNTDDNKENNDHGNGNDNVIDFIDFEDMDFFKMDCATAMSFDYEMNYTMKQLKHIAGYYGIKTKSRKVDAIQDIVVYETDPANGDAVARRKRLFHYMDALKNDEYFKTFIIL